MKIIKKINNNVAVGLDSNENEIVVFGKGIGFHAMPYELKDLSRIERTYYNIEHRYYKLLNEIPENVFLYVNKLLDVAKKEIKGDLNPNLVFILADHLNFAIMRNRKNMDIPLPYSYELEYQYPKLNKISSWFVKKINEKMHTTLGKGEITSITMHFLNALEGSEKEYNKRDESDYISSIIKNVTTIIENFYDIQIDKKSFYYFRFKNHIKFFVHREKYSKDIENSGEELFEEIKKAYPHLYECVVKVDDYFAEEFQKHCSEKELLYLMLHIQQLYKKEDCNRKGITPEEQ